MPRRYTNFFNQELGRQVYSLLHLLRHSHIARGGIQWQERPWVRIRLAPAGSLQTFGPSRTALPHLNYTAFPGGGRSFTSIWDDSRIGYNILCEIERSADSWRGCWSPWATLPGQLLAGPLVAAEA